MEIENITFQHEDILNTVPPETICAINAVLKDASSIFKDFLFILNEALLLKLITFSMTDSEFDKVSKMVNKYMPRYTNFVARELMLAEHRSDEPKLSAQNVQSKLETMLSLEPNTFVPLRKELVRRYAFFLSCCKQHDLDLEKVDQIYAHAIHFYLVYLFYFPRRDKTVVDDLIEKYRATLEQELDKTKVDVLETTVGQA